MNNKIEEILGTIKNIKGNVDIIREQGSRLIEDAKQELYQVCSVDEIWTRKEREFNPEFFKYVSETRTLEIEYYDYWDKRPVFEVTLFVKKSYMLSERLGIPEIEEFFENVHIKGIDLSPVIALGGKK